LLNWSSAGKELRQLIREQARQSFKGSKFQNAAAPLMSEFLERKMLAKLGYTTDIGTLSSFKAHCFTLIQSTLNEEEDKQSKKKSKRVRNGSS
jgi:hypothetical protein